MRSWGRARLPPAAATVGLALVIAIIRTRQTPEVDEYSDLKE